MEFDDVLEQVLTLLERDKRLSYRGIKRRFGLDDEYLEDLKEELLFSHPEISEPDGRGLIWNGEGGRQQNHRSPHLSPYPRLSNLHPSTPRSI